MPNPVLFVRELCFGVPAMTKPIIDGLSFALHAGQLAVVTGSTGSGKTTLARLIAGELAPSSGSIERDDHVWWTPMGGAGLPQASTLPELAAGVEIGANESQPDRLGAMKLASQFGIRTHDLGRPIAELSYGNRQKALVALALGCGSHRLVILDEPFAGVDRTSLQQLVDALRQAARAGMAIVAVNSVEVPGLEPDVVVEL